MVLKRPKQGLSLRPLPEVLAALGKRAQQLRLLRNRTQDELAARAGVGVKALRRFELSGEGTLQTALRVAVALDVDSAFDALFAAPPYESLADIEARLHLTTRKRARRHA